VRYLEEIEKTHGLIDDRDYCLFAYHRLAGWHGGLEG
jgi:hypothetical protein